MKKYLPPLIFLMIYFLVPVGQALQAVVNPENYLLSPLETISVEGNKRFDQAAILSIMGDLETGKSYSQQQMGEFVKKLFRTGYFQDIQLLHTDNHLTIQVIENTTVNQVVFEGNNKVDDKTLKTGLKIRSRMILNQKDITDEVERILAIYRLKGYFAARVSPKVIYLDSHRVDLIFEIYEGEATKIHQVRFIGNDSFSSWDLQSVIGTKKSIWWKFFQSDDTYDPDKLQADRAELRKFYLNHGYAEVKILSADAELLPNYEGFIITFHIEEGKRFKFGKVTIENKIKNLSSHALEEVLSIEPGNWYGVGKVEKDIQKMTVKAGSLGQEFIRIIPEPKVHKEEGTIDIKFVIDQGKRIFINDINILGNVRTIDSVIRREMDISEYDAFNASRIRTSERRIDALGFFKTVDIKQQESSKKDFVNLDITVEEQPTGDINFGGGFSTTDGLLAMFSINERNLFGRGYELGATVNYGKRNQVFDVDFINPALFGRRLTGVLGGFYNASNRQDVSSYKVRNYGLRSGGSYPLSKNLTQGWHYTIARHSILGIDKNAFALIREDEGNFFSSTISHTLTYDRRDNRFAPTEGYVLTMNNTFAGLGGDVSYLKNTLTAAYYHALFENVILGVDATAGILQRVGKKRVRITDKFLLGGNDLRGFDYSGVGPQGIGGDKDALGGNRIFRTSAEISFPLGLPKDLAFSGHVFVDAGTLWDTNLQNKINAYNKKHTKKISAHNRKGLRASAGIGITWASPMGKISIDYARPFLKQKGDKTQYLLVQFGGGKF